MGRNFDVKAEQEDWSKVGSWRYFDPYCIFFIYPWSGEPFIVKGGRNFCENYLNERPSLKAFIVTSLWHEGKARCTHFTVSQALKDKGLYVFHREADDGRMRFFFRYKKEDILVTRRWPSKFPEQIKENMRVTF